MSPRRTSTSVRRRSIPRALALIALALALALAGCAAPTLAWSIRRGDLLALTVSERAERPALVVDLDDTVVRGGFGNGLRLATGCCYLGSEPFASAPQALTRLASTWNIVFLTARDDWVDDETLAWLDRHEFPAAPVVFSSSVLWSRRAKEDYKASALAELRARGLAVRAGVGDKASDIGAYWRARVKRVFLILENADDDDLAATREREALLPSGVGFIELVCERPDDAWEQIAARLTAIAAADESDGDPALTR